MGIDDPMIVADCLEGSEVGVSEGEELTGLNEGKGVGLLDGLSLGLIEGVLVGLHDIGIGVLDGSIVGDNVRKVEVPTATEFTIAVLVSVALDCCEFFCK